MVVDHWPLIRLGITRALQGAGVRMVAEVERGDEGVAAVRNPGAELLVLGEHLDTAPGETVRHAKSVVPSLLVVALVGPGDLTMLRALVGGGVDGLLVRTATAAELVDAVERLGRGERCISPALLPSVAEAMRDTGYATEDDLRTAGRLTAKEREVLVGLAQRHSNKEIASALYVSEATVKTHVSHIIKKLDVTDRHDVVARAVELGLLR